MELFGLENPNTRMPYLRSLGMDQSKSITTPVNTNLKLKKSTEESELADEALYQSAVGSLLYLSVHYITNNIIIKTFKKGKV